ncbi:MAG TPA: cation-transporting P-type ATPase, partial [Rhodanobacteraceae bacterium]|nr:cation-transporting P-type ATPase [Rhodanobacteraceae bacterium]
MNDEAPGASPRVPAAFARAARDDGFDADLGTLLRALGTTPQGLDQAEAARRLAADGPNEPLPPRRHET